MICPEEGQLQAWLDGELGQVEASATAMHVKTCPRCQVMTDVLRTLATRQETALRAAWGEAGEQPAAGVDEVPRASREAWEKIVGRVAETRGKAAGEGTVLERTVADPGGPRVPAPEAGPSRARRAWRRAASWATAAVVVTGLFVVPPVRSAAADFLSVFRVERLDVIPLTSDAISQIQRGLSERGVTTVDLREYGDIEVSSGEFLEGQAAVAAAGRNGFRPLPDRLGDAPVTHFGFKAESEVHVALKVDPVNRLLEQLGSEERLPAALDGQTVRVFLPGSLYAFYEVEVEDVEGVPAESGVPFGEPGIPIQVTLARAPEIVVPSGFDPEQARQALLSVPFLPSDLRRQLEGIEDWRHTLVIPLPAESGTPVDLDGVQAWVFVPERGQGPSTVLWLEDEVISAVTAPGGRAQVLELARQLRGTS